MEINRKEKLIVLGFLKEIYMLQIIKDKVFKITFNVDLFQTAHFDYFSEII